ncbi:MAG: FxsA family protein [Fibrobacter sp.]|nr:FxsA family protein [Fibrobacter sp.]
MIFKLFLLFTIIPLAELLLLVKLGTYIGALNTVLIVVLTAVTGAALAKRQGTDTLWKIRQSLSMGHFPADNLIDGLFILTASLFLITPGLITDITGFLFLTPVIRDILKKHITTAAKKWVSRSKTIHFTFTQPG